MADHDTWRDQIRDILDTCTCTPPPIGEGPEIDCPMHGRADYQADAVMPILDAALAQQAERILHEIQVAHARTVRRDNWKTSCTDPVCRAFVTCEHIARQHAGGA